MRSNHFTRPTVTAALALLEERLTQAKFDLLVFRLELEQSIPSDKGLTTPKKAVLLGRAVFSPAGDAHVQTLAGTVTLTEAVVREAVDVARDISSPGIAQEQFIRALALDGFVVEWANGAGAPATLRAALPAEIDLPETDDEVHQLLKQFSFQTARGHLDQAIEAHTRGDWAAANSQTRTFIESLFDEIAHALDNVLATAAGSSENRRAMLAKEGFLSVPRNEWTSDGKNFVNGLFKMMHTEGSHPGLSDEDRSTFRLHLAIVTARTFLRRLKYRK